MKSQTLLLSLLLSVGLFFVPVASADNSAPVQTLTEADSGTIVNLNQGQTIAFKLQETCATTTYKWNWLSIFNLFSDSTVTTNDPTAAILKWTHSSSATESDASGPSVSISTITFVGSNIGQTALCFTKLGTDPLFKCEHILTYIVNVRDPAAVPAQ